MTDEVQCPFQYLLAIWIFLWSVFSSLLPIIFLPTVWLFWLQNYTQLCFPETVLNASKWTFPVLSYFSSSHFFSCPRRHASWADSDPVMIHCSKFVNISLRALPFWKRSFGLFHSTPHPGPWHNVWHTEELLNEIWNDHEWGQVTPTLPSALSIPVPPHTRSTIPSTRQEPVLVS